MEEISYSPHHRSCSARAFGHHNSCWHWFHDSKISLLTQGHFQTTTLDSIWLRSCYNWILILQFQSQSRIHQFRFRLDIVVRLRLELFKNHFGSGSGVTWVLAKFCELKITGIITIIYKIWNHNHISVFTPKTTLEYQWSRTWILGTKGTNRPIVHSCLADGVSITYLCWR